MLEKNHEATGFFVAVPRFSPWHPVACAALAGAGEELGLAERLLSLQSAVHQHVLWESAGGKWMVEERYFGVHLKVCTYIYIYTYIYTVIHIYI